MKTISDPQADATDIESALRMLVRRVNNSREIARQTGLAPSVVSKFARGGSLSLKNANRLTKAFGLALAVCERTQTADEQTAES